MNDFQQLLLGGAIKELGVYVDTVGAGGSSTKSKDSFYAANQDLEFVDRLADSGQVLTSGVQRRGDPMQNGDGVFNTLDDQLYNSLNAGNDGIFGTMDDFYSTTPYDDVALSAAHTDADADNNRDLLDTAKIWVTSVWPTLSITFKQLPTSGSQWWHHVAFELCQPDSEENP